MAKNKKSSPQKPIPKYIDLFYMTPSAPRAKDIALLVGEHKDLKIELWEEMNVLEVILPTGSSVDFEPMEASFEDPSDSAFIKNRGIKTIFAITLSEGDIPHVMPVFEKLVERYLGFVCADSADFTPVYAGSSMS